MEAWEITVLVVFAFLCGRYSWGVSLISPPQENSGDYYRWLTYRVRMKPAKKRPPLPKPQSE